VVCHETNMLLATWRLLIGHANPPIAALLSKHHWHVCSFTTLCSFLSGIGSGQYPIIQCPALLTNRPAGKLWYSSYAVRWGAHVYKVHALPLYIIACSQAIFKYTHITSSDCGIMCVHNFACNRRSSASFGKPHIIIWVPHSSSHLRTKWCYTDTHIS